MKKVIVLLSVGLLVCALQADAEETTFDIDAAHSSVQFKVRHLYSTLVGRFNKFDGEIVADMDKQTLVSVYAEVDILSVDTANGAREKHLLTADFFESDKHPKATFKSTRIIKGKDNKGTVVGDLTIRGVTKEVEFVGKFLGYGVDHRKGHRAGFHAVAKIARADFGITYNFTLESGLTVLGDNVDLELNIEAIEVKKEQAQKTLAETIGEFQAKNSKPKAPEVVAAMKKAKEMIVAQGHIDGLKVGATAPDFKLPDGEGKKRSLSTLLKSGPVVLVFYRGEWCPYCNLQLRALEAVHDDIKKLGAELIAIAPQQEKYAASQRENNKLSYPLLSDTKGKTMREYNLLYKVPAPLKEIYKEKYGIDLEKYNGEGRWELPVTATYIIDSDGTIKAGLVDLDYTKRMEPADILKALKGLNTTANAGDDK